MAFRLSQKPDSLKNQVFREIQNGQFRGRQSDAINFVASGAGTLPYSASNASRAICSQGQRMRSAGSRQRSGEEQAPNSLGETKASSPTLGVWPGPPSQLTSAHDALRADRADLIPDFPDGSA